MQAESGETLNEIIQRKEAERSCGAGAFWWGVGTSLGDGVGTSRERQWVNVARVVLKNALATEEKRLCSGDSLLVGRLAS
jgi:hypothetical protein